MNEDTWSAIVSPEAALTLAVLAVYVGGAVGIGRNLPRLLRRDAGWRADTAEHPASSALVLAVLIALWPVSTVYLAWRIARRQHRRR
ncbi:hypothetical protein [Streptomyces ureilyticus]|uniref:Uncharacterized protein n=1 Tax=Streptomyces ureilyticus TaxID=1775131 RepID=A0ABX0E5P1_9ACTN|nr:hypothetical protein [Streptomyces ureilyticus]NGO48200.1 hypothetical protein [Streptomyces ureilyticus]